MDKMFLEDIMSDRPIKVKDDVRVGEVAHLLMRYRINGILVVNHKNEDDILGIFTTTDLLKLMNEALSEHTHRMEALKKVAEMNVGQVASKDIISLQKNDSILKAIAVMHMKNVHTIPIFDKKKLVGVIGRHDVLNSAFTV